MKKKIERSKQTVWVLTMLTIMVVLSVYYLVSEPIDPTKFANKDVKQETTSNDVVTNEAANVTQMTDEIGENTSDYFVGLKYEKRNMRSKQLDEYYSMLKSNASAEAMAQIQDKIERLQSLDEGELVLEKLLIADGYKDAVVITNDDGVDVILQAKSVKNEEAVRIIKLVSEHLNIPATKVHIKPVES
ncbi:SpoIIIAH-like family protein [Tepidibacillus fermentans]|uniref:Stage III sporulation protein AH n=1 Tax=Tepidibacillus fermentans TaxID=1281767 RepID=A0A4R3KKM3_9BACI|nr:SpoIIIAH-like family protein [Tepidibacillus fermentans]TCS84030.1 stage III sporulation protein AH [Tepidibacillus fermentans]